MTELVLLAGALAMGAGLGLLYFGGLWWTVRRVSETDRPKLLLGGSFLIRTLLVLTGFYGLIQGMGTQWEALALSLLGFLAARFVLIRRWGPEVARSSTDLIGNI